MGSKTTKTKSNETATTTPNVPSYAQGPITDYYGKVDNFLSGNPGDFLPGINSAMESAFGAAGATSRDIYPNRLYLDGGSGPQYNSFMGQADPYYADALARTGAASDAIGQLGPAQLATANAPNAFDTANVAGIGARNVSLAQLAALGPAAQAQAANAGNASQAGYTGYDAATIGDVGQYLGPNVERVQGQSLLDNLQSYMDPALQNLRDTTMASYDDAAGRQQAAYAARGAQAGAFGGSRFGIGEAQLLSDQTRNRALTDAELTSNAFNAALGASNLDAGRRQEAGMFNAGAQNNLDLARGQLGFQGAMANQGALNDARQFGAGAFNQSQLFNTGAQNDFALQNADFQQQTNLANMDAQNRFGLEAFNAGNQLSQFNAGAANDAAAQQYGVDATAAQANAAAENARRSQIYGTQADMAQFNAGQANDMAQFNSQQDLARIAQQLAAAGQTADIAGQQAGNTRADVGLQAELGQQLYQQQLARSPYGQMLAAQGLLDPQLLSILTGQTINSQSTGTSRQSGGLLSSLLGAGAQLGSAAILASDRRVKHGVTLLDREPDGLGVFSFNYIWDEPGETVRYGVMADEVAELRPWALGPVMNGIQTVDYSKLEAR